MIKMNKKQLKIEYKEPGRPPVLRTKGNPVEIVQYLCEKLNIEKQVVKRLNG